MNVRRSMLRLFPAVLFAVAAAAGCVVEVDFSPLGSYASASSSWTINGAPANAASCSAAGISTVSLVFFDGSTSYRYDSLTFPCSQGSFDSRPSLILDAGSFTTQWRAYDAAGVEVGRMSGMLPLVTTSVAAGGHINLAPADFIVTGGGFTPIGTHVSASSSWTINGMTPTASLCTAAGIATVKLVFFNAGSEFDYAQLTFPCQQANFDSRPNLILASGSFTTQWRAYNAAGTEVGRMAGMNPLVTTGVAAGGHVNLQPADFIVALGEELRVNLTWDTNASPGVMADADCATAGVTRMTYRLMRGATTVAMMTDTACGSAIIFDDAIIDPGTYSLYIEGDSGTAATKNWMATCSGYDVAENTHEIYNCAVDKVR